VTTAVGARGGHVLYDFKSAPQKRGFAGCPGWYGRPSRRCSGSARVRPSVSRLRSPCIRAFWAAEGPRASTKSLGPCDSLAGVQTRLSRPHLPVLRRAVGNR
jgi:hypothetical protein